MFRLSVLAVVLLLLRVSTATYSDETSDSIGYMNYDSEDGEPSDDVTDVQVPIIDPADVNHIAVDPTESTVEIHTTTQTTDDDQRQSISYQHVEFPERESVIVTEKEESPEEGEVKADEDLPARCSWLPELPLPLACLANRLGRTRDCPALSCRQILELNRGVHLEDGIYYLHLMNKREREVVFPAFCLMSEGGFTMVTKIPSHTNVSHASDIWTHTAEINEGYRPFMQLDLPENEPKEAYKNRLVRHWKNAVDWMEAKVALIKDGRIVHYMNFNLTGAEKDRWFSQSRLTRSSWLDLTPHVRTSFFSIPGPLIHNLDRGFVVSHDFFGRCLGRYVETAWMIGVGERSLCNWERPPNKHGLLWMYSTGQHRTRFDNTMHTDIADSMVIFLR